MVVEPGYLFKLAQLDYPPAFPQHSAVDQFGLVEAVDGLGDSIVVAIAVAANRWFDAGLNQTLAVAGGDVL